MLTKACVGRVLVRGGASGRDFLPRRFAPARTPSEATSLVHSYIRCCPRLTGRIGDDGVEELPASQGVTGYVKRTQVHDTVRNPILGSGSNDARLFFCDATSDFGLFARWLRAGLLTFTTHLPSVDIGAKYKGAEVGSSLSMTFVMWIKNRTRRHPRRPCFLSR